MSIKNMYARGVIDGLRDLQERMRDELVGHLLTPVDEAIEFLEHRLTEAAIEGCHHCGEKHEGQPCWWCGLKEQGEA